MMLSPVEQERRKEAKLLRQEKKPIKSLTTPDVVSSISQDVYQKINKNWTYVPPHTEMNVASAFWEPKWLDGTGLVGGKEVKVRGASLILKTSPENIIEALDDLINKPATVECTIALDTVKIFCMKALLGKKVLQQYAISLYDLLSRTEGYSTAQFFHELPFQFITQLNGPPIPGSIAYITNVPAYADVKPNGNSRGFNAICVSKNQYISFGKIFKNGAQPLEEIEKYDLEKFCAPEGVEQFREEHQRISQLIRENKGLFEEMRRKEQEEHYNFYWIFDAQKLRHVLETCEVHL